MTTPSPDLKPRVPPVPPGSESCGCCAGVVAETPQAVINRDGLSAIAYRIGTWAEFRHSLLAHLSSSEFPALAPLRTRDGDDHTVALIDAFACAADVLTFYQERIANESYLRTAAERISLQEMGKLIGYRLRPGVAAETWLAFALETPPAPPPGLVPQPGNFVTGVPARLSLDAGLKVQSVPGPGETPQTFETVEPLADARPEWNALRPWLRATKRPGNGDTGTYLAGVGNALKPGDALVFLGDEFLGDATSNRWDFRILESVTPDPAADRTHVTWARGLGSVAPPLGPAAAQMQVLAFRRRAAVFGHNAPMWRTLTDDFRQSYPGGDQDLNKVGDWPNFTLSPAGATGDGGYLDLEAVVPEIHNDGLVALAKGGFNYAHEPAPSGTYVELYRVKNVSEVSRADFAISGKLTRVQLAGANYASQFQKFVRETAVFARSELLAFADYPVDTPVSGDRIPVAVAADGLLPGRRLIVRGARVSDGATVVVQASLVATHVISADRCELEITPPLAAPLARGSVVVHANVALASHGETAAQILGSGDAAQPFQRFALKQLPLTWRAASNELGATPDLTVRVNDIAWHEMASLYGAKPNDRAYALSSDEQGRLFVNFGDGAAGARPPSGNNNVQATYRKGIGAAGNVKADTLTQLMSRPLGLKSVANPRAAEGGTEPESPDAARASMPLYTRTLGRAVSLLDYEDFARAYSGIAKAEARVLALPAGSTVVITLAAPGGAELTTASPVWQNLLQSLKEGGDPNVPVMLLAAGKSTFRVGIRVKRLPDHDARQVLAAVEAALRAAFSFDARALGQPVQQSALIAVAQAVPGVVAVDLTRLYGGSTPAAQTAVSKQFRLLANRTTLAGGVLQPAEILTLDPAPFDVLEEMP